MKVEFKEARVMDLQSQTINTANGAVEKQQVTLYINTTDGVDAYGVEVWGSACEKLAIQVGETYNIQCRLIGRVWGGRWNYNLSVYAAELVTKNKEE